MEPSETTDPLILDRPFRRTSLEFVEDPAVSPAPTTEAEQARISYWGLVWWKFRRNRVASISLVVLGLFYLVALPAEFMAPYQANSRHRGALAAPPQLPHVVRPDGGISLRPFVYGLRMERDPETLRLRYVPDETQIHEVKLFVRGEPYSILGLRSDIHLFGVAEGEWFPLGTDREGRDMLSQMIIASRVSLTVGLVGVTLSLALGTVVGLASGYLGRRADDVIQRAIEIVMSFPSIPLWLALSAAIPATWSPLKVYFGITVILSLIGWGHLARVVRGITLSLKGEEYILASQMNGGTFRWILLRHLLPGSSSYLIVAASLAIPGMILGETALSFLGLGIQRPMVSWGLLLQQAQDITVLAGQPWLVMPVFLVIVSVLAFNFVGDGLRDAADPSSHR